MSKNLKKILCVVLSMIMLFSVIPMSSFAVDAESEAIVKIGNKVSANDVVLKVSTSKSKYKTSDDIIIKVEATNESNNAYENVGINMSYNGFKFDSEKGSDIVIGSLAPGETKSVEFKLRYVKFTLSQGGIIRLFRGLLWIIRSLWAANSETTRTNIKVGLQKYQFVFWAYQESADVEEKPDDPADTDDFDSDGDGLLDSDEEYFGTNPLKKDTDDDGLTDYEEILLNTDPLIPNTYDKDIDSDSDGLKNIDEAQKHRTDPYSADTDDDGLNDYDEIYVYGTDPLNPDTDGDSLSDGFEVKHGLNPLLKSSDGKINDKDVIIEQTISTTSISNSLIDDNIIVPSIGGNVSGDLSENIFLSHYENIIENERPVIGKIVYVDGDDDYINGLTLSFDISAYESDINNLCICRLNEDGTYDPLTTKNDGDKISCIIDRSDEYLVVDLEEFFRGLGIDINSYISSTPKMLKSKAATETKGQADIVFVIDTTGSMSDEISNVISNAVSFSDKLASDYNVASNFALIDYRDLEEDGPGTTKIIKNGSSNWYSNVEEFKEAVKTLRADGGGDTPECAVDALETARRLDYRKNADKFIILVTDANYKIKNDYGIASMDEEVKLLMEDGIIVSVVTSNSYKSTYNGLCSLTGGICANINGNFGTELLKLADLIGSETSDGEWVIVKYGYKYIKIPAIPEYGSLTDEDGDGIPDAIELGEITDVDLTALIRAYLSSIGADISDYSGPTSIKVYDAESDPTTKDSDGDGIPDNEDSAPFSKGKKNGIIGNLLLVSCYGSSFSDGHVFFAYQSYVNDSIDFSGLVNGWKRTKKSEPWTYDNLTREKTASSAYEIAANEYVCIGNGALGGGPSSGASDGLSDGSSAGDANGVNYNMETAKFLSAGRPTGSGDAFSYLDNTYISEEITTSKLQKLISYLSKDSVNYWSLHHNCAKVGADAWNHISSVKVSAYGLYGWHVFATPASLRDCLRKIDGHSENWKMAEAFK